MRTNALIKRQIEETLSLSDLAEEMRQVIKSDKDLATFIGYLINELNEVEATTDVTRHAMKLYEINVLSWADKYKLESKGLEPKSMFV